MTKKAPYTGEAVVKRGLAKLGKTHTPGMCQKEIRQLFGVPSTGDHDGDGDADAHDAWKAAIKHGAVVKNKDPKKAPRGAYLYFSGGTYGHVALGLGGDSCVSTDAAGSGKWGKAKISTLAKRWNRPYEGYITTTGNGYQVFEPQRPEPGPAWFELATWNIGLGNKTGIKTWRSRRTRIVRKIDLTQPEVLCLQEAYLATSAGDAGLTWLIKALDGQYKIAANRSGRAILVRKDVEVESAGIIAPKARALGHPVKYATWAVVRVNGQRAFIVNVHAQAGKAYGPTRKTWVKQVHAEVDVLRIKHKFARSHVFLAGDWNGAEARASAKTYGYIDAALQAKATFAQVFKSHNGWKKGLKKGPRIDYVLACIGRPLIEVRQQDDSDAADHNYQSLRIANYKS